MKPTPFQSLLEKLNACEEARKWVGAVSLNTAWKTATNPSWMLWLYARASNSDGYVSASLAMQFAAHALKSAKLEDEAKKLEPFFKVTPENQRAAAARAAARVADAAAAAWAADAAAWAARAAARVADADAAAWAARAARAAADAAADARAARVAAAADDAAADARAARAARAADDAAADARAAARVAATARAVDKSFCNLIRNYIKAKDLKFD